MPIKKHNPPTTFAKIKIGDAFHLNGTWWVKKSSRTAYLWEMPHRWFYFSKDDLVFTDEKESKAHERSQKPRYLNPRRRNTTMISCKFTKRQQEILEENLPQTYLGEINLNASKFDLDELNSLRYATQRRIDDIKKFRKMGSYFGRKPPSISELRAVEGLLSKIKNCLSEKKNNPRKNTRRRTRRYALQEIAMKKKKSKR